MSARLRPHRQKPLQQENDSDPVFLLRKLGGKQHGFPDEEYCVAAERNAEGKASIL